MNHQIKVLIADDDADDTAFLKEAISNLISAYTVVAAKDGGECLQLLKAQPAPELIFLDLKMPLRNGVECLKAIRENPQLDATPVIIYSTSYNYRDIDKCYKAGADFYMVKPVTLTAMINLLDRMFVALGEPKSKVKSKERFVLMEQYEAIK